jgi:hypothetical protein
MGAITVTSGAQVGAYTLTVVTAASNAGHFTIQRPDGAMQAEGNVAAAYSDGGIAFTLADGATDFIVGDTFTITVAAGSGKYVQYDEDGVNGSEVAAGVLIAATDASLADKTCVILARDAEVAADTLQWPSTIETAEITTATGQLNTLGIFAR